MEFLKKLVIQTQDHLKGLTVSQKLALGSCVGLIVVALLWMTHWAGEPVMVPLLDQPITAEQMGAIERELDTRGVPYRIAGDRIRVPSDRQYRVRAQLAEARVLPDNMQIGFSRLIEQNSSPWLNMTEQDRRWALALSTELGKVIREISGVSDARVFLDRSHRRTIGQPSVVPTASVFVMPEGGAKLTPAKLTTIATMVSGAVGGLSPTNVKVADMATGRSYTVPTEQETEAYGDLAARKERELYFSNKLRELLGHIPNVLVAVHADLNPDARQIVEETHGRPVMLSEKTETETSSHGQAGAEPGVNPNTSVALSGAGGGHQMQRRRAETAFDGRVDRTVTRIDRPRYEVERLFASINVPRSYLAAIFEATHQQEPTDVDLETFSRPELVKIKELAMRALAMTGEGDEEKQVQVDWFHDGVARQFGPAMQAEMGGDMLALVRVYGPKAGLGGLAVMSLLMMLMLIRRVGDGPVLPGEPPPEPRLLRLRRGRKKGGDFDMTLDDGEVNDAAATDPLLVGKEVDELTLQSQRVVEEVQQMVKEDTVSAISILKRWIELDQG